MYHKFTATAPLYLSYSFIAFSELYVNRTLKSGRSVAFFLLVEINDININYGFVNVYSGSIHFDCIFMILNIVTHVTINS